MRIKPAYRLDDRKAGARRAFGIVFVRLGKTEIGHHTITKIIRNVPAEPVAAGKTIADDDLCSILIITRSALSSLPPSGVNAGHRGSTHTGHHPSAAAKRNVRIWSRRGRLLLVLGNWE